MYQPEHRGAKPGTCERCGAAVLRQLVGHRAALKVTADAGPLPLTEALTLWEPNRLVWCVAELRGAGVELRWQCHSACDHSAVIEHRCPAEARQYGRRPEGAMW